MIPPGQIDYDRILAEALSGDIEEIIRFLSIEFLDHWCAAYRTMTPCETQILQFNVDGFEFLFDLSTDSESDCVEERVVAVLGRSQTACKKRDTSRMRGFLGPTAKVFGGDYDKGHFIGHSLGGGLDVNLFPQRRHINRGWSKQGKLFREMERYCAENPGTFCFSRPIYCDRSWRPCMLEYGVIIAAGVLWVELFEN